MAREKIADLVLEGGGVKGIALAGAYAALQDAGYRFHCVAGTSAGAIVGALVAAGMSSADLRKLMQSIDYGRFRDKGLLDRLGIAGKGLSLLFEKGVYEGDALRAWLDGVLGDLGRRRFGDLRLDDPKSSLPAEKRYRLVVMTADVTRGRLVRLPWDYKRLYGLDPDEQLVADAVRASMSIPFFYEPVRMKTRNGSEPSLLVDGGMLSNFPIEVFDRTDGKPPRWPTFGLKLSALAGAVTTPKFRTRNTFEFAAAMIGTMTSFYDQMHIERPGATARTVFIDTFGVRTTDFGITRTTQQKLYASGRDATRTFLKRWSFSRYVKAHRRAEGSN